VKKFIGIMMLLMLAASVSGCPLDKYIDRLKGGSYGE